MGNTISARIELNEYANKVINMIKVKFGLKDKSEALNKFIELYGGDVIENEASEEYAKKVYDFLNKRLEYEIYSYGEETVVIPITKEEKSTPTEKLASKEIEREIRKYCNDCSVEIKGSNKAVVRVPKRDIARIIGKAGEMINKIEAKLGISIDVEEIGKAGEEKTEVKYNINEKNAFLTFYVDNKYIGKMADIYIDDDYLLSATIGKNADIKIHKKSQIAKSLLDGFKNRKIIKIQI